jgi:hypothetical protein
VLDEVIVGLQVISDGGQFVVGDNFTQSFSSRNIEQSSSLCNVSIRLITNGDLKFFA